MADYPWEVLDRPDMQAAMAKAGVDRAFIIQVWFQNGPEQRLFIQPNGRSRNERIAAAKEQAQATVESVVWGDVKVLYR